MTSYRYLLGPMQFNVQSFKISYVPLAFQSPYPIIIYFLANYRPHLSHFWANEIFAIST